MNWVRVTKTDGKAILVNLDLVSTIHDSPPGSVLFFGENEDSGVLAVQESYGHIRARLQEMTRVRDDERVI